MTFRITYRMPPSSWCDAGVTQQSGGQVNRHRQPYWGKPEVRERERAVKRGKEHIEKTKQGVSRVESNSSELGVLLHGRFARGRGGPCASTHPELQGVRSAPLRRSLGVFRDGSVLIDARRGGGKKTGTGDNISQTTAKVPKRRGGRKNRRQETNRSGAEEKSGTGCLWLSWRIPGRRCRWGGRLER